MILSWLIAFFILMPIAELAVLMKVHEAVGLGPTVGIVVLTGFGGVILARWQGLMVVMAIQRDLAEGRMPAPRLVGVTRSPRPIYIVVTLVMLMPLNSPSGMRHSVQFVTVTRLDQDELRRPCDWSHL